LIDQFEIMLPITVQHLGRRPYREVWELQKRIQRDLLDGISENHLIFCEHEPVITLGRSAKRENILLPENQKLIEVIEIERGGDVTYHGPGQIVCYPLLDLSKKRRDVCWYMRTLEEVIIRTLNEFSIVSDRVQGRTGVWIRRNGERDAKIASIGLRLSRWRTLHGFSLNVQSVRTGFSMINPCGFSDISVTSISEQIEREIDLAPVAAILERHFCALFEYSPTNSLNSADSV